jgi:Protein of unknown function (DUF3047)
MKKFITAAFAGLFFIISGGILAQDAIFWVDRFSADKVKDKVPEGWELEVKTGEPELQVKREGEGAFVRFKSDNSSFGIRKEFDLDSKEFPYLNWKWKVAQLPEKGDFRKKDTDDQAAQVYVLFPHFPANLNTDFVCYYWESNPKNKGLEGPSVAWSKARVIVLQAGKEKLNQWVTEKRNVLEDYKRLFGKEPPKVGGVAFYINSQHTQSSAESFLREIYFSKK